MSPHVHRLRWAVAIHAAATFAATGAFKVVASYGAIDLGFSPAELGILAASFGVPPVFIAFHAGRWTDRIGGLKVTLLGDVLMLVAAIVPLVVVTPISLIIAAAILGLAMLLSIIGQHALIAGAVVKEEQERVFGWLFSANAVGQMFGPVAATALGSTHDGEGLSSTIGFSVAGALALAGLGTLLLFGREAWRQTREDDSAAPPAFRAIGSIIAVKGAVPILSYNAIIAAIIDMLSIFLPAWGAERQIAPIAIGILLSLRSAASIVVRFFMLPILRVLGRRNLLVGSAILTAISLAAMPFVDLTLAYAIAIALGLALGLAPPISLAWVSLTMPPSLRGSAVGLRIFANRLAQAGVPAAVGLISAGVSGMFLSTAALMAAASVLVIRVPFPRTDKPQG